MELMKLPRALAERGYRSLQLCHFHLPSRSAGYVSEFKAALLDAGVSLHALLIDDGDVTDPENGKRDLDWIAGWMHVAEQLGAKNARVIAGRRSADRSGLTISARRLERLADETSVRLITENWFELTSTPDAVLYLLDSLEGRLGLCVDFGNWPRPRKYEDLPQIMPRAECCHAKFEFLDPANLDEPDATACLKIADDAHFTGPFVLVNGGSGESEWDALEIQAARVDSHLALAVK
jgi:sugar phosphate isomerase/epimerase